MSHTGFHAKVFCRLSTRLPAGIIALLMLCDAQHSCAQGTPPAPVEAREIAKDHPLFTPLMYAKRCREMMKEVKDYTCSFAKRDLVDAKVHTHVAAVKFRVQPTSVYMKFGKPHEGREVMYVAGQNNGKLLAHEGSGIKSLVGTLSIDPRGDRALAESRHPITEFGMHFLLDGIIEQWEREAKFAGSETQTVYYDNAKLQEMTCQVIEIKHPQPRRQFKFHITRLYFNKETSLPVRLEQYAFPARAGEKPPLVEEYTYWNIRTNVGLTDEDFDRKNPQYQF